MTSMIQVHNLDCYVLIDLGAISSIVPPYMACKFYMTPECLLEPFSVSTSTGHTILVERVYRECSVLIYHRDAMIDLVS